MLMGVGCSPHANTEMKIPERFYMAGKHPVVKTVGELKAQFEHLPDDLIIGYPDTMGDNDGRMIVVYNHGDSNMHLDFEEVEEEDEP